jgi:hypothetical protein
MSHSTRTLSSVNCCCFCDLRRPGKAVRFHRGPVLIIVAAQGVIRSPGIIARSTGTVSRGSGELTAGLRGCFPGWLLYQCDQTCDWWFCFVVTCAVPEWSPTGVELLLPSARQMKAFVR